ncbi:MAG: hypothetical protein AAFY02_21305 [Pseudomonadota bacterium]
MTAGKDQEDAGFDLEGTSGSAFEAALRKAEQDLKAPVSAWVTPTDAAPEAPEEPAALAEDGQVSLSLTLRDSAALVGEFSGANEVQGSTPSATLTAGAAEGDFAPIPRSGQETTQQAEYEDWLEPMSDEEAGTFPGGGLTAGAGGLFLGDFSGAESVPEEPPAEPISVENDGLPSLTARDDELLSDFSGAERLDDLQEGHMDLDEVIFSDGPDAKAPALPKVTERTEPEFLFKD